MAIESLDDMSTDKPAVESPLEESSGHYYGDYVDFNVPWSLRADYSWSYSRPANTTSFTHTIRILG